MGDDDPQLSLYSLITSLNKYMEPSLNKYMDAASKPPCIHMLVTLLLGCFTIGYLLGRLGRAAPSTHTLLTRGRRSVVKYSGKANKASVERALEAAVHAPNHWLNEPWRFRILGQQTWAELSELNPNRKELFDQVPHGMVVSILPTTVPDEPKWNTKSLEDHAACACAVQNFMVSLASEGVGSKWMTGAMGIPADKMLKLVGAGEDEHYMGCILFGKPSQPMTQMKVPERKLGVSAPIVTRLP